jgi:hypothetical protein
MAVKKFIYFGLTIMLLGIGGIASAGNDKPAPRPAGSIQQPPPSFINDIKVPFEVLMYVQTEYQGFAVTEAAQITRDGKQVYRLRVDRDDDSHDYESFYLLYDSNWKLIGKDTIQPPPKPQAPPQEVGPEQETTQTPSPQGGRGTGEQQVTNDVTAPAPTTDQQNTTDGTTGTDGTDGTTGDTNPVTTQPQ